MLARIRGTLAARGRIDLPGDKSISHRALLLAALAEGESTVVGRAAGEDQDAMVRCLRALGVVIEDRPGGAGVPTRVRGVGLRGLRTPAGPLDCGNSGATMRFLMGALAGMPGVEATLIGDASLSRRPMERVAAPLRAMGARIETSAGGTAPVTVHGAELHGVFIELDVASAQVKTAVLLAALNAGGPTTVREPAFTRDHTERMLRRLGVAIEFHQEVKLAPPKRLPPLTATIPGDPSSAAFWAVLAAIHRYAELELAGVCVNPGRTGFSRVLSRMGARLDVRNVREVDGEPVADLVVRGGPLRAVDVSPEEVPGLVDEVPVLAVAAAFATAGESRFRGLGELRLKEVDRLAAIAEELEKLGAPVGVVDNDLVVGAGGSLHGASFDSRGDHRIAMAMAVAASAIEEGESEVAGAEAAAVSYPRFWDELRRVTDRDLQLA